MRDEMDFKLDYNKIVVAFTYILMGLVITSYPDKSISINIAKFIAWLFIIIGQVKLIKLLNEKGQIGAILILVASIVPIVTIIFNLFTFSIGDFIANQATGISLSALDSMMSGGLPSPNMLDSLFSGSEYENHTPIWAAIIQNALLIGGLINWILYEPFKKAKSDITKLLVVYSILLLLDLANIMGVNLLEKSLLLGVTGLMIIILYYNITVKMSESNSVSIPTKALLLLGIGFIYSLLALTDNSTTTSLYIIIGSIVFLIGNNKLRGSFDRAGTGAFIGYGVLTIIFGLIMMIPLIGGVLSTPLQVGSYIVLAIGFFKFESNQIFDRAESNGMKMLGVLVLLNIILAFIPTGMGISAFLFCLIEIPLIIIAWGMAVNAVKRESLEEGIYSNSSSAIEESSIQQEIPTEFVAEEQSESELPALTEASATPTPIGQQEHRELSRVNNRQNTPSIAEERQTGIQIPRAYIFLGIAFLIVMIGIFSYVKVYKPYARDRDAPRTYTYSNITNMRSSKISGSNFNILTQLPYGAELITYGQEGEWTFVKSDGQEGYIASYYLLAKDDFELLNGIFGDKESRACIETAKCKLALIDYFKTKNLFGHSGEEVSAAFKDFEKGWQVFAKDPSIKPNSIAYPRIANKNSKYTDFAVIITNIHNNKRRLLVFTFNDVTEKSSLIYEDLAPESAYIKSIQNKIIGGTTYIDVKYQ